jgi:two-component system, NtrC family, nitrogen regulation response regulator GlnG
MPGDSSSLSADSTQWSHPNSAVGAPGTVRLPGLTVLYHPDLQRVGERALLADLAAGRPERLSRLVPRFAAPVSDAVATPIGHLRLSREPLLFETRGDGILLRLAASPTTVVADGQPVTGERLFEPAEIERGVVLLLAGRVVLLLHRLDPYIDSALPRYGLVGEHPAMIGLRRSLQQAADAPVPVLLRGESGTGKELVAAALHQAGDRRDGPFLAVNMAAVPATLAAAELFGAARGAFTGADRRREGFFARAHGGTLFLDEVGEMPVEVQTLLLRCLETGEIQPVGEAPRRVDVRLISATDADLEAAVAAGRFRAPLLYRLEGYCLRLPPLRERREDFGRLLVEFLRQELAAVGESQRLTADPPWLPAELVARLALLLWPGNVRQLRNVIRQLVLSNRGQNEARLDPALAEALREPKAAPQPLPDSVVSPSSELPVHLKPRKPAEITEDELLAALRATRFRPHAAARRLGIPRPSIYHLMNRSVRVKTAADLSPQELAEARERFGDDLAAMAAALEVSEQGLRRRLRVVGLK